MELFARIYAGSRSGVARGGLGVLTPSIEKGVNFYCLVMEQKQIVATRCHILRLICTKFRFRLGLRPRWGSSQRSPRPLLDLRGPTSKGREGSGRRRGGIKGKGRGEKGLEQ